MSATIQLSETESESVRYTKPKSETKFGDRNVDKENREYQVKKDNRDI